MKARTSLHKNAEPSEPPKRPFSRKRLWLFRAITLVLLPLLLFSAIEGGLRLFGYGYPTKSIVKQKLENKEVYCQNYQFGWRFFPRNIARNFDGIVFDTEKSPETYRIFVLGASAAMGMPAPAYNFGRILEVMLDDMYPDIDFEVHTVAMVAINSYAVLEIAKDCAKFEPDLFIIYLGNNEVVGPFGPGTVLSPVLSNRALIRANLAVKSTRTGQLVEQFLNSVLPQDNMPHRWGGLEMFLNKQVRQDSHELERVYRNFEMNLRDICRTCNKSGAAVIVSNVACNLKDNPPFASLHRPDLTDTDQKAWDTFYQQGIQRELAGDSKQAIAHYLEAGKIDSSFADLQFRLGRCYWNSNNEAAAKDHYQKALEYDTLRFRPDTRINEIIRSVASNREKQRIHFVDSIAGIEVASPHQTPGAEYFYEHVHFNFSGNYIMAKTLFPVIQQLLPTTAIPQAETVLSETQCGRALAYTDFERHEFLNKMYVKMLDEPPFTNQLYHDAFMIETKQRLDVLKDSIQGSGIDTCLKQHQKAVDQRPDDWALHWRYAVLLGSRYPEDLKAQEQQLREVLQCCPYDAAYLALARNLHRQGTVTEAIALLYDLLKLTPNAGRAHVELASIYRKLRNDEKYIEHLSKSLTIDPTSSIEAYGALAEAYDKTGQPHKAIETLYKATRHFPEAQTAPVHASLGYLLNTQGKPEKALEELKLALKINPDFTNDRLFKSLLTELEAKANQ